MNGVPEGVVHQTRAERGRVEDVVSCLERAEAAVWRQLVAKHQAAPFTIGVCKNRAISCLFAPSAKGAQSCSALIARGRDGQVLFSLLISLLFFIFLNCRLPRLGQQQITSRRENSRPVHSFRKVRPAPSTAYDDAPRLLHGVETL